MPGVFNDGGGAVRAQALRARRGAETLVAQDVQSAGFRAYPEISLRGLPCNVSKRPWRADRYWRGAPGAGEPADQAGVSADPERTGRVCKQGLNARAGQLATGMEQQRVGGMFDGHGAAAGPAQRSTDKASGELNRLVRGQAGGGALKAAGGDLHQPTVSGNIKRRGCADRG